MTLEQLQLICSSTFHIITVFKISVPTEIKFSLVSENFLFFFHEYTKTMPPLPKN